MVTIEQQLCRLSELSPPEKCCIYRVPRWLRCVREEAYTPVVVSIGPFHHKNQSLLPMETFKLRFLRSFMHRSELKGRVALITFVEMIKEKEGPIRDSYAEHFPMSSDEFVFMVLVDSIFIMELFCFNNYTHITPGVSYIDMYNDLMLAENQLPLFILVDLYTVALKPIIEESFTYIACKMLGVDYSRVEVDPETEEATTCFHLLDLTRSRYLPLYHDVYTTAKFEEIDPKSMWCPTAMSLYEEGVKFRVSKNTPGSFVDLYFDTRKGIVTLPLFNVDEGTELLHKNLIAIEQCRYWDQITYIGDYFAFMNCLIDTREDVKLLEECGIIINWLRSEEAVAHVITSLSTNVVTNPTTYYYATISKKLNSYTKKRRNRFRASLNLTRFRHPWVLVPVIYSVIVLLITIGQLLTGILVVPGVKK